MSILQKFNIPSWSRWRALPSILNKRERLILPILTAIFIAGSVWLALNYYYQNSAIVPAYGGQYKEALIGSPQYINPILAEANEVDRDLSILIFSGLMKYDNAGVLKPDIAESYEIADGGKSYIFRIRKDVFWHDGPQLATDDVIFTINTLQNPEYKSPLAANWRGVKAEKIDDFTVKFSLGNAFSPFLENLTIGILPKHIWENIAANGFQISDYNLKPIGSGPYKFSKIEKNSLKNTINFIELKTDEKYYSGRPFIKTLVFKFYNSESESIEALTSGEVDGISYLSPQNKDKISSVETNIYNFRIPRYVAVFLNQNKSKALSDINVRKALAYGTDKKQIINDTLKGEADIVDTPILRDMIPEMTGNAGAETYEFSLEKAKAQLAEWKDADGDGILEKKILKTDKESTKLEITISTSDWTELAKIAEILKSQWEKIGIKVNLDIQKVGDLTQKTIKPREFDALLFGEILYMDPDPFSFWHSSQKKDPGLNLAMYDNPQADKLLEDARQTLDFKERVKKYDAFQQIVANDAPAVFLFSPHYLYAVDNFVKGIETKNIATPARRFSDIEKWYIKTDREFKK